MCVCDNPCTCHSPRDMLGLVQVPTFSYGFSPKGQPAGQANTGQGSALCKGENPYENVGIALHDVTESSVLHNSMRLTRNIKHKTMKSKTSNHPQRN